MNFSFPVIAEITSIAWLWAPVGPWCEWPLLRNRLNFWLSFFQSFPQAINSAWFVAIKRGWRRRCWKASLLEYSWLDIKMKNIFLKVKWIWVLQNIIVLFRNDYVEYLWYGGDRGFLGGGVGRAVFGFAYLILNTGHCPSVLLDFFRHVWSQQTPWSHFLCFLGVIFCLCYYLMKEPGLS